MRSMEPQFWTVVQSLQFNSFPQFVRNGVKIGEIRCFCDRLFVSYCLPTGVKGEHDHVFRDHIKVLGDIFDTFSTTK